LTYTFNASNSTLSADAWKAVTVTDVIPNGLTFVNGSVSVATGGKLLSAAANYVTTTRTLMVNLGDIPIGQTATIQFKVTVDAGMQGKSVDNTAIAKGADGVEYPATSGQTVIDDGNVIPTVVKTSMPDSVYVNDTIHYTVTVKNGTAATVNWRDVVVNDTLPVGLSLSGVVYIDGCVADSSKRGSSINVSLGDIAPGQSVIITYDVIANAAGEYVNTAVASSANSPNVSGSDNGVAVTVPSTPGVTAENLDYGFEGSKAASVSTVNAGDDFDYTIIAKNPAGNPNTWYDVVINDPINLSYIIPYIDSVTINGVAAGARATFDSAFNISLGNISPGETVTVKFTVKATNDAAGQTITNVAYINGYSDPGHNTAATVIATADPVYVAQTVPPQLVSNDHIQLFNGYDTGEWLPDRLITRAEIAHMLYKIVLADRLPQPSANKPLPSDIPGDFWGRTALMYFYNLGALNVDASGAIEVNAPATMDDIVKCAQAININLPALGYQSSTANQKRLDTAKMMCAAQGRDTTPNTNGCRLPVFTDISTSLSDPTYLLIVEVSTTNSYVLQTPGNPNEIWVSSTWSGIVG
jgi:fimbrial isopeptide formation D2 family protein/uncharacterized repeat protein (TIGR01451 family)